MFSFFYKLLGTLNSAQSPWQVSLSLSFGLISGFLPIFTPLNIFIFFLIFSFNIPIGLYFASLAVFSIIGYFLDPIFSIVGYSLLSNESLIPLWTLLYNNPLSLWSSFNYTTVLGGFVIGLPLSIFAFFLFKSLIPKYRDLLLGFSSKGKLLSWLNPYSETKLKKKPGLIRWWGSLGFVAVFSGVVGFALLVFDPLLKIVLEKSLSTVSKRDVIIKDVASSISDLKIEVNNIEVYDKNEKEFTIDSMFIALDPTHSLEKKIDVTELGFLNLKLIPTQTTQSEKNKIAQRKEETSFTVPKIDLPDVNTLLAKEGIKTFSEIDRMKERSNTIENRWEKIAKEELNKEKIKDFERRYKEIKAIKITDANSLLLAVEKAKSLKEDIESYKNRLKEIRTHFSEDTKELKSFVNIAKTLPEKEYKDLKEKYSTLNTGALNFVSTYISPALREYLETFIGYYHTAEPYLKEFQEETVYPRDEGQWIHFENRISYPRHYVRVLKGNIISNSIEYSLVAKNLTDNQKILNIPTTGTILSTAKSFKTLQSDFTFDTRSEDVIVKNLLDMKGYTKESFIPDENFDIKNSEINFRSDVTLKNYQEIEGVFATRFIKAELGLKEKESKILEIVDRVLGGVDSFDIYGKVYNNITKPKLDLDSDIDEKISRELKGVIASEKRKFEKKLKARVEQEITKKLQEANINPEKIAKYKSLFVNQDKLLSNIKKELEDKYSKEKLEDELKEKLKNKLQEKAKDKLKKFLKF